MSELTAQQREKMIADLRTVMSDAEHLLKLTVGEVGEGTLGLRERLQERLVEAKHQVLHLQATAVDGVKAAGHAADDYVHNHPWQTGAVGIGIGLVLGLLIGHRR